METLLTLNPLKPQPHLFKYPYSRTYTPVTTNNNNCRGLFCPVSCKLSSQPSKDTTKNKVVVPGAAPSLSEDNEPPAVVESRSKNSTGVVVRRLSKRVLSFLANLPLALGEMFTIAGLMALGTAIDQGEKPEYYFQKYPEDNPILGFFTWRWILTLGFDHMFSSPVFLGTLVLLAASLMACTYTTQIPMVKVARRLFITEKEHMANGVKNRISTAVKELETLCNNLLAQPPLAVEAAVVTAVKGVDGALIRSVLDTIIFYFVSAYSTPSRAISLKPRWIDARNTGVFIGANAGITCVMKKIRGKEDSQTRMVAGFGAGVLFSMVHRDPPEVVIVCGVMFALMEEGFFKVKKKLAA